LFAAEPPSVASADGLRDKRVQVFRAIPSADPKHYVQGQYHGYQFIEGVKPDSQTETFAALRLEIDNWRWSGVPFFIRAGKALPVRATEIRIIVKRAPKLPITRHTPDPNELILRIDPNPGANLVIQAKEPRANRARTVDLSLTFAEQLGEAPEPYERLLSDAMNGDSSQFTREQNVEETWRIVQPLLDTPPPVQPYKSGSWGPPGADMLLAGNPGWRYPWPH
jgi:glucose-6-phosphate 1-dehydrogenase